MKKAIILLVIMCQVVYAAPYPEDSAICDNPADCVLDGTCYSQGPAPLTLYGGDVDNDGDRDYCLGLPGGGECCLKSLTRS